MKIPGRHILPADYTIQDGSVEHGNSIGIIPYINTPSNFAVSGSFQRKINKNQKLIFACAWATVLF